MHGQTHRDFAREMRQRLLRVPDLSEAELQATEVPRLDRQPLIFRQHFPKFQQRRHGFVTEQMKATNRRLAEEEAQG